MHHHSCCNITVYGNIGIIIALYFCFCCFCHCLDIRYYVLTENVLTPSYIKNQVNTLNTSHKCWFAALTSTYHCMTIWLYCSQTKVLNINMQYAWNSLHFNLINHTLGIGIFADVALWLRRAVLICYTCCHFCSCNAFKEQTVFCRHLLVKRKTTAAKRNPKHNGGCHKACVKVDTSNWYVCI